MQVQRQAAEIAALRCEIAELRCGDALEATLSLTLQERSLCGESPVWRAMAGLPSCEMGASDEKLRTEPADVASTV